MTPTMIEALLATALALSVAAGPLAWRVWTDRRTERALRVHADVQAAVNRRLGGESMISINVQPPALWRRGRVLLSAPAQWEWLIEQAWMAALARVPDDYELVVRPVLRPAPHPLPARRAA